MNIKSGYLALFASLLAGPAFAHPGDHGSVSLSGMVDHALHSPFHVLLFAAAIMALIGFGFVLKFRRRMLAKVKSRF